MLGTAVKRKKKRQKSMNRVQRWKRKLLMEIDMPEETEGHIPKCTLVGTDRLLVENHAGVLCLEPDCLRFATGLGAIRVTGDALELSKLSEENALVTGRVTAVCYEDM